MNSCFHWVSIPGSVWQLFVITFLASFVCVWLDLKMDVMGIQNDLKINFVVVYTLEVTVHISGLCSSMNKVQSILKLFKAERFSMGYFWGLLFGPGIFFGEFCWKNKVPKSTSLHYCNYDLY